MNASYVVITPVRDEVLHIGLTISSMESQTIGPRHWILVDDGSTDGTGPILDVCAQRNAWVTVIHRRDRGRRTAGGGVIEAFLAGYDLLRDDGWDFIVKLDGDLSFPSDYFESCLRLFKADERLGIAGGTVLTEDHGTLSVDSSGDPPFHVRGATKIYRRDCWTQICPLVQAPGWDTIDEVEANRLGWRTKTFREVNVVQHKKTGAVDGRWRNWYKNGFANYMTGYHPIFMLAKCVKRAFRWPFLLESAALGAGFCSGYLGHTKRPVSAVTVRFLRQQQLRRMLFRPSIYD